MTDKKPEAPPPPSGVKAAERPRWRRWLRRLAKAVGVLFGLLVLLLFLLPTIITILPVERWVSGTASDMFEGELELEGLSLGWFSDFKLARLELRDPGRGKGEQLLLIENFSISRSLLQMAFTDNRVGTITIDRIKSHVVRNEAGSFNFEAYIPESAPAEEAPPEESAEPFKLDLEKLIPEFPVPISEFHFHVNQIDVKYDDYAMSPTLHYGFEEGMAKLDWEGGVEPMTLLAGGAATDPDSAIPLSFSAALHDWVGEDGMTTFKSLSTDMQFDVQSEQALLAGVSLQGGGVESGLTAQLAHWLPLAELSPVAVDVPKVTGTVDLSFTMKPDDADWQGVTTKFLTRGITVAGLPGFEKALPIPDISMEAGLALHQETFDRDDVHLTFITNLFEFSASEKKLSETPLRRQAEAAMFTKPENLLEYTENAALAVEGIPAVEGEFELKLSAVHDDTWVETGTLTASWSGKELRFKSLDLFPENFHPVDDVIDLSPTSFVFNADAEPESMDAVKTVFKLENGLLNAEGSVDYKSPAFVNTTARGGSDLTALMDYVNSEFFTSPTMDLKGQLAATLNAESTAEVADHSGRIEISSLWFNTGMFPDFEYEDDLALAWKGHTQWSPTIGSDLETTFEDRYTSLVLTASYWDNRVESAALETRVALGLIAEEILPAFVPELPVTIEGDILFAASVSEKIPMSYETAARLEPGDGFVIYSEEYQAGLEQFLVDTITSATITTGGVAVDIARAQFNLEDYFESDLPGTVVMEGESIVYAAQPYAHLVFDPVIEMMAPYMEESFEMLLVLSGETEFEGELGGVVRLAEEGIQYPEPLAMRSTLSTTMDVLEWQSGEQYVALEGLEDTREWTLSIDPNDLETLDFAEDDSLSFLALLYGEMAAVEELSLDTRAEMEGINQIVFTVNSLNIASTQYQSETMMMELPDLNFEGEFRAYLDRVLFQMNGLRFFSPELFAIATTTEVDWQNYIIKTDTEFSLPNVGELPGLIEPNMAADYVQDLAGQVSWAIDGGVKLSPQPDGSFLPTEASAKTDFRYSGIRGNIMGMAELEDASGILTGGGNERSGRFVSQNEVRMSLPGNDALPGVQRIHFGTTMELDEAGDYRGELSLVSENFGTSLVARARIDDALIVAGSFSDSTTGSITMRDLLTIPASVTLALDQKMAPLASTPWLDVSSGTLTFETRLTNIPESRTEFALGQTTDHLVTQYGSMFRMEELNGSLPLRRILYHDTPPSIRERLGRGEYYIDQMRVNYAPYDLLFEDIKTTIHVEPQAYRIRILSSNILGASVEFLGALALEGEHPVLEGTLSITGLDAAYFVPETKSEPVEERDIDSFGTVRWLLPENPTMAGLFETLDLRLDVAELGKEVLRGILQSMNEGGFNPGIQSALAALRFNRPSSGLIQIQSGLMNVDLNMKTAVGSEWSLPIFDRVNVANLLNAYASEEMDAQLKLLRQSLLLLLAEDIDALTAALPSGEVEP